MTVPVVGTVVQGAMSGISPSLTGVTTSGSDRQLLVVLGWYDAGTQELPDFVRFNSVDMVLVDSYNGGPNASRAAVYRCDSEPEATTANVTTSFASGTSGWMAAIPLSSVNQSTPVGTTSKSGGTSRTDTNSPAVSATTNDLVIDALTIYNQTVTLGSGQTSLANGVGGGQRTSSSSKPGDTSVTMSQSWNTATTDWGHIVVPVIGTGGATTLTQAAYRFVNDDGSESGSTFAAAQNTDVNVSAGGQIRLRFGIQASGDPTGKQFRLEYDTVGGSNWKQVP